MDNKHFPENPGVPQEPEDDALVQELLFPEEAAAAEQSTPAETDGRAFMDRIPDVEEDYQEPMVPEQPTPQLGRQPDLQEVLDQDGVPVAPEETAPELPQTPLTTPQMGEEITLHHQAMDFQGLLNHNEEEPPFDLSLLDEFAPEPEPATQEEVNDQEYRDNGSEFDAMMDAPAAEEPVPSRVRPTRKGRPKRKKGEGLFGIPNMLVTVVWLALILAIGVTLGRMLWVCAADVLAFGREDKPVTVTVYESDTMEQITEKLYDAGLIRYRSLFNLYASISDAREDIKPGIYDLNTRYDYHALVSFMTPSSSREVITLTIPEGYTCRQIFNLLEENRICTAVDIGAYAASGELSEYWFLENVERGDKYCLEGFLFPDTYEFYKNSSPLEALEKMLDNFDNRFDEDMRAQLETLNANVTGGGYGVREVVIVASLIEKEAAAPVEAPAIAGVIYNRLFRWEGTPAYLNIDASLVYAQDGNNETIDTSLDSPYNTYTHIGLTPTPISNPGLSSLQAALDPESHDYFYYVLNPSTGMHQFSSTYEEHENWRSQFAAASSEG